MRFPTFSLQWHSFSIEVSYPWTSVFQLQEDGERCILEEQIYEQDEEIDQLEAQLEESHQQIKALQKEAQLHLHVGQLQNGVADCQCLLVLQKVIVAFHL